MLETEYPDLAPLTKGASFVQVIQTLYYAHLLRYSAQEHLKTVGSWKIATKNKLETLVALGYLVKTGEVFKSTSKTLELLTKQGYNPAILPPPAEGSGAEIYNSDALVKIIGKPFYRSILYPHFGYLIPDALAVFADGNRYQLRFIEVEAKKPKWEEYIDDKLRKYERLARDEQVYRYWREMSQYLGLKCPAMERFRFGVEVIKIGGVYL